MSQVNGSGGSPLECALTAGGADVFAGLDDASPQRRLARLAELVPLCVPECCGATATLSADGDSTVAASHPDLADLTEVQLATGEGTIPEALRTNEPAEVTDVLCADGWPNFRAAALDTGVRSGATLPFNRQGLSLTVTLYGFQPGPLRRTAEAPVTVLGELLASAVAQDRRYEMALAAVDQMDAALRSRPVVDQACGILMHATGCGPDEAFDKLRSFSQQRNEKLVDIARTVVSTRGAALRPADPADRADRPSRR